MRTITKGTEPGCLAQARRNAKRGGASISGSDWPGELPPGCSQDIRDALVAEQHNLCVYCGGRIHGSPPSSDNPSGMTIEHWEARATTPALTFTWSNLFGVCRGESISGDETQRHCDTARGDAPLYLHPANTSDLEGRFRYGKATGEVSSAQAEDEYAQRDIDTLNLNARRLCENRKEIIERIRDKLRRDDSNGALRRLWSMHQPRSGQALPPYAFVARSYLRPKMSARGLSV